MNHGNQISRNSPNDSKRLIVLSSLSTDSLLMVKIQVFYDRHQMEDANSGTHYATSRQLIHFWTPSDALGALYHKDERA
jgi:hypothetical protein